MENKNTPETISWCKNFNEKEKKIKIKESSKRYHQDNEKSYKNWLVTNKKQLSQEKKDKKREY